MVIENERVFSNNWMSYELTSSENIDFTVSALADIDSITPRKFKEYRRTAVTSALAYTGPNPAVMLSGGIDSQAMVFCFSEAGVKFTPVILDYSGKNEQDVNAAIALCSLLGLEPLIVSWPAHWFLSRKSIEFGLQHGLRSPQFASHAGACALLKDSGFSGAIFGGNSIYLQTEGWVFPQSAAQVLDLATFSKNIDWPIIGSFFSWTWELCLATACVSYLPVTDHNDRHKYKLKALRDFGCVLIDPGEKYTGFEQIKKETDATRQAGYFESLYRAPLIAKTPNQSKSSLNLTPQQTLSLNKKADFFKALYE